MKYGVAVLSLLSAVWACVPPAPMHSMLENRPVPQTLDRPSLPASEPVASQSLSSLRSDPPRSIPRGHLRFDPAALERAVIREGNIVRRRSGSRALSSDPALARAARRYAQELARRGEIEHLSRTPGRRTFRDRIHAEGGRARIAGENLARLTAAPESMPNRVVRAWLKSPGHRANLLDPVYARTGVGVWLGADGIWYIVQVYATGT